MMKSSKQIWNELFSKGHRKLWNFGNNLLWVHKQCLWDKYQRCGSGRIRFSDNPGDPVLVDAKLDDFDLERAAGKGEQIFSFLDKDKNLVRFCLAWPGRRDGAWRPRVGGDHTITEARPDPWTVSWIEQTFERHGLMQGGPRVQKAWGWGWKERCKA